MNPRTLLLQARLWRMYGDKAYAAERDGNVYGGGKLSQRFWEYHKTIDALELTADSVVLGGLGISRAGREQTPPIGLWKPVLLKFVRTPTT